VLASFSGFFDSAAFGALVSVLVADLVLAGDNAMIIGVAAAGLSPELRRRAVVIGLIAATTLRIGFALVAVKLLAVIGLTLAGGILLLWVAWKMLREVQHTAMTHGANCAAASGLTSKDRFRSALLKIVIADVSMSLDNVLAVAGAARDHIWVLVTGLVISVALTGLAASMLARLLGRYRWISYVGLAMIGYIACRMIWDGAHEVMDHVPAP
jgi:YjbE family integral membrane protein